MTFSVSSVVVLVCLMIGDVNGDYSCLCSYQLKLDIFEKPDNSSNVDEYMYEFDCKPTYKIDGLDPAYRAIGNEGKLGYVQMTTNIQIQTCQGNIPEIDRVKTTTLATTTLPPTKPTTMTQTKPMTPMTITLQTTTKKTKPQTTMMTTPQGTVTTTPTTTNRTLTAITLKTTMLPTTHLPPTKPMTMTQTTTITPTTLTLPTTTMKTNPQTTMMTTPPGTVTTMPTTTIPTLTATTRHATYCPTKVTQTAKPNHVSQHGQLCYEFVQKNASWMIAKQDCNNKGGYLVSIENEDQQSFFSVMLARLHYSGEVWIGLHDRANEENWQWDSGIPATYTNWIPGRFIDQYHDQEDCGLMIPHRKGKWDDVDCNGITFGGIQSYPWMCQYHRI